MKLRLVSLALFSTVPYTESFFSNSLVFAKHCRKINWFSNKASLSRSIQLLIVKCTLYLSRLRVCFPIIVRNSLPGAHSRSSNWLLKGFMFSKLILGKLISKRVQGDLSNLLWMVTVSESTKFILNSVFIRDNREPSNFHCQIHILHLSLRTKAGHSFRNQLVRLLGATAETVCLWDLET